MSQKNYFKYVVWYFADIIFIIQSQNLCANQLQNLEWLRNFSILIL